MFVIKRDINPFTLSLLKEKLLKAHWGLKISKQKQTKFCKKGNYKTFTRLFESIKQKSKHRICQHEENMCHY